MEYNHHLALSLAEVFKRPGELYASLFANSLDGMIIAAHEGTVLSANPAASTILGFDAAQFRQMAVGELFDGTLPEYRVFKDELTRQGKARAEVVLTGRRRGRFQGEFGKMTRDSDLQGYQRSPAGRTGPVSLQHRRDHRPLQRYRTP